MKYVLKILLFYLNTSAVEPNLIVEVQGICKLAPRTTSGSVQKSLYQEYGGAQKVCTRNVT
jgi:hypothetical protein